MAIINGDNDVSYNLDYRWNDDAWYTCGVVLQDDGNRLRVKFQDFPQTENDVVFSVADFTNHDAIETFSRRFRPISEPLDHNECSRVIKGMLVCALYRSDDGSRLYFDAIVDDVLYKEHTPANCLCTYFLFWQHGPAMDNITAASLDDICLIMPGPLEPRIIDFAKLAREKVKAPSSEFRLIPKKPFLSIKTSSNETFNKSQDFGSAGNSSHAGFSEGRERLYPELSDQDRDMGDVKEIGYRHYIILENLEKNLCPTLMMELIHEQTSITGQAYVFPSLSEETYARGAIAVDSRLNLKRIYDFINNPNHFIVSFSGRPWVIAEDKLRTGTFNTDLLSLEPKFENINIGSELMIVRLGTEEYNRAKKLKQLYMEFRNHINGLVRRFDMEEKKNHHPSTAN